jgi:hypothetical protein
MDWDRNDVIGGTISANQKNPPADSAWNSTLNLDWLHESDSGGVKREMKMSNIASTTPGDTSPWRYPKFQKSNMTEYVYNSRD